MSYHLTTGNHETRETLGEFYGATFDDRDDAQSAADYLNGHFEGIGSTLHAAVVLLPPRLIADMDATSVEDEDGGVWWPGEGAQDEIADAWDPRAEAVRICREDPSRGEWSS